MTAETTPLWRLARVVGQFRSMDPDAMVAAVAAADGGAAQLTYGDLQLLARQLGETGERLNRIGAWHTRETGPGGMVGHYCTECWNVWPCDTRRMADGTYVDSDEVPA